MSKIIVSIFFLALFGCSKGSSEFVIEIKGDVPVFQSEEHVASLQSSERLKKSIAMLKAGDKAKIIDSIYGKDYLVYQIKSDSGVEGYVIHGDKFEVNKMASSKIVH